MPPLPEASMPCSTMSSRRCPPDAPLAYSRLWYRAISVELSAMNRSPSSLVAWKPGVDPPLTSDRSSTPVPNRRRVVGCLLHTELSRADVSPASFRRSCSDLRRLMALSSPRLALDALLSALLMYRVSAMTVSLSVEFVQPTVVASTPIRCTYRSCPTTGSGASLRRAGNR